MSIWENNKRTIEAYLNGTMIGEFDPEWLRYFISEAKKEHEDMIDMSNRFDWLLDTMPVDYDDLFEGYDEDE